MMERAALFDFDGTLCPGDSIVPWLQFCIREGAAPAWQWFPAAGGYLRHLMNPEAAACAKESTLSFIRGKPAELFTPLAARFMAEKIAPRIYPAARKLLEDLHASGVKIAVISASADMYMRCLPGILPVDCVIATTCETDGQGRYTGRITSNCRGEEKVRRWQAWNHENGWEVTLACGDSSRDLPMLSLAADQLLVNPGKALRQALPEARIVRWQERS